MKKFVIGFLVCMCFVYLSTAFIELTLNPIHWSKATRAVVAVVGTVASVFISAAYQDLSSQEK